MATTKEGGADDVFPPPFFYYSRTSVHWDCTWPFRPHFGHVGPAIDRVGGRYGWTKSVRGQEMHISGNLSWKSHIV